MLIEFSVSNFRSFREKQTFSMVATPRLVKKGNVFKPQVKGEKIPNLLKVAAVYGPNASGKSNLISALGIINDLTNKNKNSEKLPVAPFRFDPALADQPSRFEFNFIAGEMRYEFLLAATPDRIVEEQLIAYPNGKESLLYHRQYLSSEDQYKFGELEGGDVVHEAWKNLTSSKQLFISQAVANSNESLKQLKIPHTWLERNLKTIPRNMEGLADIALAIGNSIPNLKLEQFIASFLQEIDVPISHVKIEKNSSSTSENLSLLIEENTEAAQKSSADEKKKFPKVTTTLTHKTSLGEATFDLSEESDGTRNLIGFSLPWMILNSGSLAMSALAIDELDSSLHPKIVASLIDKLLHFSNPAQLIFTTHDTHLMDTKLLRRDQIWLTERDNNGATQLRSIHDFQGRESEDVEKRYYEGRYRGLPVLM